MLKHGKAIKNIRDISLLAHVKFSYTSTSWVKFFGHFPDKKIHSEADDDMCQLKTGGSGYV